MSQQFPWGSSSQQPSGRRGLPPISTTFNPVSRSNSAANSPSRASFSPVNSSLPPASSRRIISRTSSASSTSTPFSPSQSALLQHQSAQLLPSARPRAIVSSGVPHFASSAAALGSASERGGGVLGVSGGGSSKVARASPSLSQSGNIASPSSATSSSTPSGQSLAKIVIAQVFLLLSSLKEDKDKTKWEQQTEQIRKLIDSNGMEVFSKYFRRLLQSNASQIFPGAAKGGDNSGTYPLLVGEMQKITQDPQQAYKIAESIDTTEGDLFRDFDLSTFMEHFKLDAVAKTTLALACKTASKPDLRTKADAILSNNYQAFLMSLINSNPDGPGDLRSDVLASVVDRLAQDPPRNWSDDGKANLFIAIRAKFEKSTGIIPLDVGAALYMFDLLENPNPLIRLAQRAGPRGTSSVDACKELLASAETRDISYQQVANVLLYMAITQNGQAYNLSNFVAALREHRAGQRLDWQDVVHSFDREGLKIVSHQFVALFNALLPVARDSETFDIQTLWGGRWSHQDTQLSFVVAFLQMKLEDADITQTPRLRKAFTLEQFEDAPTGVKDRAKEVIKHPLVSLDATAALFNIIFQAQEFYNIAQRSGIPQSVINQNTDIFVVAAAAVPKPWVGLQDMAMRQLFGPFFEKRVTHYSFALHGLYKQDSIWVASRFLDFYTSQPLLLPLILEHAAEHGWVHDLARLNTDLSIDLAALAHSEGLFELDPWAQETMAQIPVFPRILANFLSTKAETDLQAQRDGQGPTNVPLAVKTVHPLLGLLQGNIPDDELVALQRACIQAYPRLINYGEGFDEIIDVNGKDGNAISSDADRKMQEHYKKMYSGESGVRDVIEELQRYKTSEDPADQDLFSCMIHGLFDEYNCFSEYPLEALATTAVLFGGIIQYNLLSRIPLQAGLAMVLEAVQDYPPEASMYKFGLQALLNFSGRLQEWPSFCDRLLRVPGLQGTEVWNNAEEIVRRQRAGEMNGDTNGDTNGDLTNGVARNDDYLPEQSVRNFSCIHADPPLRPELYEEPDEDVQDKVLFVLNNVSERNLKDKLNDLKEALEEKHHQWFAGYLVEERAKMQPNFQQLYLDMLALFNDKVLWAEVLRETYVSVIRMLNAESTMNSSTERTHLKNLGGWLGQLTIARNKPIKFKNISFKDLLIEGHDTQRLLIVIPFTCKVLIQASKSTVFKPPNPWLMEIIHLLMELYHFAELKLNLKFEIEVLCKGLDLDYKNIEPSNSIRSRPVPEEELLAAIPDGLDGFNDLSLMNLNRRGLNERFSPAAITAALPDLSSALVYPPASGNLVAANRLRQIFHTAAQSAIAEIIAPVVERSVTIAAISTSQLVAKDFAMEPDENKLREAAHTMVKSLSGSLALVTCKEPLRMSIMNNIRILARDLPEQALPEGLILMFVNDNLDTVCGMVEQAAENQSVAEIDMQISAGVQARRYHRSLQTREPFNDPPVKHWATFIPEPYRQNPGGLNAEQLAIYEDFGRQARGMSQINNTHDAGRITDVLQDQYPQVPNLPTPAEPPAIPRQGSQPPSRLQTAPPMSATVPQTQLNGYMDTHNLGERTQSLLLELQRASKEATEEHIEELGPTAPTRDAFEQLIHLIDNAGSQREHLCLGAAGKVTHSLFADVERRLEIEVFVQLLLQLCQLSVSTSRQVLVWLANIEDERLLNPPVVVCLLAAGLLDLQRVDLVAYKAIQSRDQAGIDLLARLLDEVLLTGPLSSFRADFSRSLEALTQWLSVDEDVEGGKEIIAKMQVRDETLPTPPSTASKDQVEYVFEEWIHLQRYGHRQGPSTKTIAAFVSQLHARGFLKARDDAAYFIRVCIEASVAAYEQEEMVLYPSLDSAYIQVDALAKLIVGLVVYHGGADGVSTPQKVVYLENILSLIVLVLANHQRTRVERFNQKVFFRLFSSLLCELHEARDLLGGLDGERDLMMVMGRAFLVLQPKHFPSFSFSWLALVSQRMFMPAMLRPTADESAWNLYAKLMELLLAYAGHLVKPSDPSEQARAFYRGILRVLLVVHHDFPEFLAENHFALCNAIPMHCTQLRNLVVSAYPSSFPELPDPFTNGFKVDRLEEVRKAPELRGDIKAPLQQHGINDLIENLLKTSDQSAEDINRICEAIYNPKREDTGFAFAPVTVDTVLLHSIVLYVGDNAISTAGKGPAFTASSPQAKLLETLARELRPEGCYHFISAMANQLRWPNSHTHYFSYAILHLFGLPRGEQANLDVQQIITRVLLERLLVHRPHPWGLIITLLEILKNSNYEFWNLPFVKVAPEVERLFGALFQHINQSPRAIS
ncbi:uncharacterized protein K452DRAFT_221757 [Aplosporella prunicola CBS 121167]|uniref:General negative regulator of transcription subunit 1 n=1 Tax=Aplosporella prunicola CBS 121167 TaxID=1176127 RepID=A0A6A6BLU6_9PEZI|nr:uncharacterized protein K452DRAFT_221757 [Aplosporella prunicola CBS 121167]KAF2145079.1 hypothetical protein K452DRAFT_221757 [Aplosporella prunicola CBS 121167]